MRASGENSNESLFSSTATVHPSPVIHLDDTNATSKLHRRAIIPHNAGDVHPLVQRRTPSKVDKVGDVEHVVHLPGELLVRVLEVDPGSAHGGGDIGADVGEGETHGLRGGDHAEEVWHVGDLEPENLVFGIVLGLDQVLHRVDLCWKHAVNICVMEYTTQKARK